MDKITRHGNPMGVYNGKHVPKRCLSDGAYFDGERMRISTEVCEFLQPNGKCKHQKCMKPERMR